MPALQYVVWVRACSIYPTDVYLASSVLADLHALDISHSSFSQVPDGISSLAGLTRKPVEENLPLHKTQALNSL